MAAYVIVNITITDPVLYQEYIRQTPPSIAAYGGRFIVRGGQTEALEGDWKPNRVVVLEFESYQRAKAWWASEEYAPAMAIRHNSAKTEMILVDGYVPPTS